jgi:transposase
MPLITIGEDRTERLEIIPAQPKVIVTIRPKYACPKKQGGVVQALAPVHLIEGDRDASPIAGGGLKRIVTFYKIEEAIRGQSAAQRKAARQEQTKPMVDDFEVWLKTQRSRISTKSRLGEKLSYIAKYMDGLKLFLEDGTVEMDSNVVERAIRPIALNRKNALFAGHDEGGRAWARI